MLRLNVAATSLARIGSNKKLRAAGYWEFPVTAVLACLKDEVCPAIAAVWHRPSFRNLVLAPHATLLAGIDSPARNLVDGIRHNLLAALEELRIAMDGQASILRADPQTPITANRTLLLASLKQRAEELTDLATQEWVSVNNFFRATRVVWKNCRIPLLGFANRMQCGELIGKKGYRVPHIGNLIVRGMLFQIEDILEQLGELSFEFRTELVDVSLRRHLRWRPFIGEVQPLLDRLRFQTLSSEEGQNSESAMILTQVFADATVVTPDIAWLGLSKAAISWPPNGIRAYVAYNRDYELIDRIVLALTRIAEFYEQRPPNESEIEDAIETGGLVVVEESHKVHWQKKLVDADWKRFRKPWELMLRLARTRGRGSVSEQDVYGQPMKDSTFPNLRSDLGKLLPDSLDILIEPAELKAYQICLPYNQFHLFPAPYALEMAAG